MINNTHILIALTAAALVGAAHADAVYSTEDFESGTVCYSINGVNNGTLSDSWFLLTADTATAFAGTDYLQGATSRVGIVANGDPTDISPGGTIPTGQHALVSTSQNRNLTSIYPMTLASDGATSLDISFSFMFYALENYDALGSAIILYSALGNFSDTVQLYSFGFGQVGSIVETPDYSATQEVWATLNLSFTEAGAGITFTDTAKIRINRAPLIGTLFPAGDATTNHIVFLDDITVSSVGSASTTPPQITSITSVGGGVWELTLKGDAATAFEFRESATLDFNPGTLVENLTQGNPGSDPGSIGGTNDSVLTTDASGDATVRITLTGDPMDFVLAQSMP